MDDNIIENIDNKLIIIFLLMIIICIVLYNHIVDDNIKIDYNYKYVVYNSDGTYIDTCRSYDFNEYNIIYLNCDRYYIIGGIDKLMKKVDIK